MKLSDLRKVTVRKHLRVRFRLPNGMECILNEHGVAQLPSLRSIPDFNLEEEFAQVDRFVVETLPGGDRAKAQVENLDRQQLLALASPGASAAPAHEDHDE